MPGARTPAGILPMDERDVDTCRWKDTERFHSLRCIAGGP